MPEPTSEPTDKAKPTNSIWIALVLFAIVCIYFAVGTVFRGDDSGTTDQEFERPLFTVLVQETNTEDRDISIQLNGRTEADDQIVLRAETPGQVAWTVETGARVKRGDRVCELNTDSRTAQLDEAVAAVAKAEADFQAAQRLFNEGFMSDTGLKTARAALDGARARETRARIDLANVRLTAPFDGVVADVVVDPGDVLGIGGPCAVIANLNNIIIAGGIPASEASRVSVGDSATVNVLQQSYPGTVAVVGEVANDRTRAFRVEIALDGPAPKLQAGLAASAEITAGASETTQLPRNALVFDDAGRLGVRIVEGVSDGGAGRVAFRPVELVSETQNGMAVIGVAPGSLVIVRGQEFVSEGIEVAVERAAG